MCGDTLCRMDLSSNMDASFSARKEKQLFQNIFNEIHICMCLGRYGSFFSIDLGYITKQID